jgi:hypothetical protein
MTTNGHGLQKIERLALRNALDHVDQRHVGQFLGRNPVRGSGAHVPSADNRNFLSHSVFS